MLLFVPGFARAYWSSVRFFLVQGRTNFPLPIPWPWLAWQEGPDLADRATALGLGLGFLLMPLVCGAAALLALTARRGELPRRALLAACGFVGLVYMHHAFSRADFYHLAPAIPPLLLGLLALVAAAPARYRWAAWLAVVPVLAFTTFFVVVRDRPLYEYLVDRGTAEAFVRFDAAGDRLWVDPSKAALLYGIESEVARLVPPGEPILIVPDKAGLYPLLHRESPVWDIYPIWPDRDGRLDAQMLRQMRA